ncbi:MAG: LemA family protein [Burkholderiaceae bacterium]|jgi:LemA protein|nr:LemA family protein [Burkholderiaceae bacterium]
MTIALWITLAIVVVALAWGIGIYNRLVQLRNRIANAFAQIDVQLKRRYDLIPNLVEATRAYIKHEASTLEAVISARGAAVNAASQARARPVDATAIASLGAAEQILGGSLGRLFALAEAYPTLKADETVRSLTEELTSTENRVSFARQAYNDEVLTYNNARAQFPDVLVAQTTGFAPAAMLESTQSAQEREAPRISL